MRRRKTYDNNGTVTLAGHEDPLPRSWKSRWWWLAQLCRSRQRYASLNQQMAGPL